MSFFLRLRRYPRNGRTTSPVSDGWFNSAIVFCQVEESYDHATHTLTRATNETSETLVLVIARLFDL